jgi:AsmA protein
MLKFIKRLIQVILSFFLILLVAGIILFTMVDPNDYKQQIAQQVYDQTGRTLTITGDINFSFSLPLSIALTLGKIELSNAPSFTDKPFAQIQNASLVVSILPLFTDNQIDIGEIQLKGLILTLMKNQQGKNNWDDLQQPAHTQSDSSDSSDQTVESKSIKTIKKPTLRIAGLTISEAQINWIDQQQNQQIQLSKSHITMSELIEDQPFTLQIKTHIENNQPAISGDMTLQSTPTPSLSNQQLELTHTVLSLDLKSDIFPKGVNHTQLKGDIVFNGKTQQLHIKKMQLKSLDLKISGAFHLDQLNTTPKFKGQFLLDEFSPKQLAHTLDINTSDTFRL